MVIMDSFHFFYHDWKGMLSPKKFLKVTLALVYLYNYIYRKVIEVIVWLTMKAFFIYFCNIRKNTNWSVVSFICSSIIFMKWVPYVTNRHFITLLANIFIRSQSVETWCSYIPHKNWFLEARNILYLNSYILSYLFNKIVTKWHQN